MSEAGPADLIADLLLRHYREPMRYRGQAVREAQALGNLNVVLRLALGRPVHFEDPALQGHAVTVELERAAAFHIQQSFFRDGASNYDILGLAPDASPDSVRENFRLLMQLVHPDRHGADTEWPEGYAARANRAYSILKGGQTRADYDRQQAAARVQEAAARTQQAGGRAPSSVVRSPAVVARTHVPARAGPGRQPLPAPMLPEWLTAGVGGFVLRHPGFTVFAGLIAVSAVIIGAVISPEHENALHAVSTYTVPETVERTTPNRPHGTEVPPMERVAGLEPRDPMPLPSAAPEGLVATTAPAPAPEAMPSPAIPAPPAAIAQESLKPAPSTDVVRPVSAAPAPAVVAPSAPLVAAPPPAPTAVTHQPATPPVAVVSSAMPAIPAAAGRGMPATVPPLGSAEVESLIAMFVSSYEKGTLPVFANLFDDDAQTNSQRGRIAIRSEYERLFQSTAWRRMKIVQMRWQVVGDRTEANGVLTLNTGWPDGRETEQRLSVNMDLVRHGGRLVIARFSHEPR